MCGWFACAPLALLLAVNRFVQMIFPQYADRIFSRRNTQVKYKLSTYIAHIFILSDILDLIMVVYRADYYIQSATDRWLLLLSILCQLGL